MKKILLSICILISIQASAQNQATFYTTMGDFVVEMYNGRMPVTTTNFEGLVNAKFYDSIIFHRVISNFMNQGGDPATRGGSPSAVIQDEFDATTSNLKYTIAMANSGPNTGTSQFFINAKHNTFLDFDKAPLTSKHPVFGEVKSGFSVIDAINVVTTDANDKPITDVRMDSVRMTYVTPVAVADFKRSNISFKLSPNPININSSLSLSLGEALNGTMVVTNIEGKELFREDLMLRKGKNKMNINELNIEVPGVYFIQLNGEQFSSTKKLLVQ